MPKQLNEQIVKALPVPARGNKIHYFPGAVLQGKETPAGFGVRVTAAGARSFVMNYRHDHIERRLTIGKYPNWSVLNAVKEARDLRQRIDRGEDPLAARRAEAEAAKQAALPIEATPTYGHVVAEFIEHYAKPRQRTWDQTERILKGTEKKPHPWLNRPLVEITKQEARARLRGFVADGHDYKANVARAWLKKLFKWAAANDYIESSIMEVVEIEIEKHKRDRFYTDAEIRATWSAANKLDPAEAVYVKLLMLLAPRKTSLACITRRDLDKAVTLWTVPFDLTKSRKKSTEERTYLIPLPALCQRLFKGIARDAKPEDRLFPELPIYVTKAGRRVFESDNLKQRLVQLGAPADFQYRAWRHTIATFLKGNGYSKWERGLILNHAESGVAADYSHGYPLELKLKLLSTWADHVESLVQPQGAALLR